ALTSELKYRGRNIHVWDKTRNMAKRSEISWTDDAYGEMNLASETIFGTELIAVAKMIIDAAPIRVPLVPHAALTMYPEDECERLSVELAIGQGEKRRV